MRIDDLKKSCISELLFSEKHLCNSASFRDPFFKNICKLEIKNIDKRIKDSAKLKRQKRILLEQVKWLRSRLSK